MCECKCKNTEPSDPNPSKPEPEATHYPEPKQKPVYDLWYDLFQTRTPWYSEPEGWQAWNGAVIVTLDHVVECLCGDMSIKYDDLLDMKEKIRKKLIC